MDGNTELLNYIYQNSQMGIETIEQLLKIVEDKEFTRHLQVQLEEYKSLNQTAKQILNERGHEEKEIGNMEKITSYMSINLNSSIGKVFFNRVKSKTISMCTHALFIFYV